MLALLFFIGYKTLMIALGGTASKKLTSPITGCFTRRIKEDTALSIKCERLACLHRPLCIRQTTPLVTAHALAAHALALDDP